MGMRTYVLNETSTIREVILHGAHIEGGVHAGSPKNDLEEALSRVNREFSVGGHPPLLRQLKSIGAVVLRGLQQIRQAVENELVE
jgi:hypothetical protein